MVAFSRLPVSQAGRLRMVLSMIHDPVLLVVVVVVVVWGLAMVSMYDIFSMH